jgi:hypothetical protein
MKIHSKLLAFLEYGMATYITTSKLQMALLFPFVPLEARELLQILKKYITPTKMPVRFSLMLENTHNSV